MSWACPVQDARGSPHTQFKRETKSANDRRPLTDSFACMWWRCYASSHCLAKGLRGQGLPWTCTRNAWQIMANLAAPYGEFKSCELWEWQDSNRPVSTIPPPSVTANQALELPVQSHCFCCLTCTHCPHLRTSTDCQQYLIQNGFQRPAKSDWNL